MENGKASPATKQCFTGGEHSVRAKDLEGNGGATCSTLADGLAKSQNLVLARLAHRLLSPPELRRTATAFGFGVGADDRRRRAAERRRHPRRSNRDVASAAAGFGGGHPRAARGALDDDHHRQRRRADQALGARRLAGARLARARRISDKTALDLKHMLEGIDDPRHLRYKVFHKSDGSRQLPDTSVAAKTGALWSPANRSGCSRGSPDSRRSRRPRSPSPSCSATTSAGGRRPTEVGRDFLPRLLRRRHAAIGRLTAVASKSASSEGGST